MPNVAKIDGDSVRELLAASVDTLIIDFYADWCAPCRAITSALGDLAMAYDVQVLKVNVDENADLADEFAVQTIPTLVRIDGGREQARSVGVATAGELADRLGLT